MTSAAHVLARLAPLYLTQTSQQDERATQHHQPSHNTQPRLQDGRNQNRAITTGQIHIVHDSRSTARFHSHALFPWPKGIVAVLVRRPNGSTEPHRDDANPSR